MGLQMKRVFLMVEVLPVSIVIPVMIGSKEQGKLCNTGGFKEIFLQYRLPY
jgi:hypothetical protein